MDIATNRENVLREVIVQDMQNIIILHKNLNAYINGTKMRIPE